MSFRTTSRLRAAFSLASATLLFWQPVYAQSLGSPQAKQITVNGKLFNGPASLDATTVGIKGDGTDNSPLLQTLKNALSSTLAYANEVVFPPAPSATTIYTPYYFSNGVPWSRGGMIDCHGGGPRGSGTAIVVPAGVHGVVYNLAAQSSDGITASAGAGIRNCAIISIGWGTGFVTQGGSSINTLSMYSGFASYGLQSTWSANDGLIAYQSFNNYIPIALGVTGSIATGNPAILTVTSMGTSTVPITPSGVVTGAASSGVVNNSVVKPYGSNGTTGTGGTGTYALNVAYTTAVTSQSLAFKNVNPAPIVAPGAFIDSVSGSNINLNAAFPITLNSYDQSAASVGVRVWQLPASRAYPITTTSGSNCFDVTATQTADPAARLAAGDMIWSDAFPFGTTVFSTTGVAGAQHVCVYQATILAVQPASVTHAAGSGRVWVIPACIMQHQASRGTDNYCYGFPIGRDIPSSSSMTPSSNADHTVVTGEVYEGAIIGRLTQGNNTGASFFGWNEGIQNYLADFVELGTVGSTSVGENSNSAEAGTAPYAVIVNCTNQNFTAWFNEYWGGFSQLAACAGSGANIIGAPTIPGASKMKVINPLASVPVDMPYELGSSVIGGRTFGVAPCINVNPGTTAFAALQFSKDCGTSNSVAMQYDSTTDSWSWFNGSAGLSWLRMPGINYTGRQLATAAGSTTRAPVFPLGFDLGGVTTAGGLLANGTERHLMYVNGLPATSGWNWLRGDVWLTTLPAACGNLGWSNIADGVNPNRFGPISCSSNRNDWQADSLGSNSATNTDLTGRITLSSGSATFTFGLTTNVSAPNCWVMGDETTPSNGSTTYIAATTTGFTLTGTGSDVIRYGCLRRN